MTIKRLIFFLICFICAIHSRAQNNRINDILNCDGVKQIAYYLEAIQPISMGVLGAWDIKQNKTIHFSKKANLNLDSLDQKINRVKKYLPNDFIRNTAGGYWYDNKPNENDSIWFIRFFAKEIKENEYTIYLAFKITFEGTDAMKERTNPKVLNVEFITEKKKLEELAKRLKTLSKV